MLEKDQPAISCAEKSGWLLPQNLHEYTRWFQGFVQDWVEYSIKTRGEDSPKLSKRRSINLYEFISSCIYCNEQELSGKEDKPNDVEIYSFTQEKVISLTTSPEFIETSDRM